MIATRAEVDRPNSDPKARPLLRTTAAVVGSVVVGALYPLSAAMVSPWLLPAAVVGLLLLIASLRRPGIGVAVAFLLTSLTPGLGGPFAWVPGVAWTALLFGVLLLRPASNEDRIHPRLPPFGLAVLAYGATVLLAFSSSPAPDLGFHLLRNVIAGIVLFLVVSTTLRTAEDVRLALLGTSGAAVIVGGFASLQYALGASSDVGFVTSTGVLVTRVTAGFIHPNLLAGFLVVLVPLATAGAVLDRRWRLVHLAGLFLALGGIYASFSRGALLGLLVMPFLLVRGRWLAVLAPIAALLLAFAVPSVLAERFNLGSEGGAEVGVRRDIWSTAGAVWQEQPLDGAGLGGFPGRYAAVRVSGKQFLPNTQFEPPPHAHNLGLQLLAEQGLVGFASFGVVAVGAGLGALRLRRSRQRFPGVLGAALLSGLVGLLVHNLFDVTLVENAGIEFWGVLGVLSAMVQLHQPEASADGT